MDLYRKLPKVDALLADPRLEGLPHPVVVAAAREVLDTLRAAIGDGSLRELPDVVALVEHAAGPLLRGRMRPVINATGVIVHTNLGRAPWPPQATDAALRVAEGYCNLEVDLATGNRGGRMEGITALARHLTGAEAALVVNNCAAAVLLALTALARDRDVIVSRGELVEIGGSFRVPDVIASGGARLVEVGTTNRTSADDYARAIGPETAVLLIVHPSNFRIVGFTRSAQREQLVALAAQEGLVVVEDLGSGSLDGEHGEPSVREAVRAGVDLVLFSGDKLLGGPQAGIVVGRRDAVRKLRAHPLYRALRVDKVILAALEQTLAVHVAGGTTPVGAMMSASAEQLEPRAHQLCEALGAAGVTGRVEPATSYVGGGSLPHLALPSYVVAVAAPDLDGVATALRCGEPAIAARVADGALCLDVRTLRDAELPVVARRVAEVMGGG